MQKLQTLDDVVKQHAYYARILIPFKNYFEKLILLKILNL